MKDVFRLGICLLVSAWASAVHSVVMVPFTIETLAERAQLVVHGIVSSTTCQRDDAGRIYTQVELQISEVWKGRVSSAQLQVVHGGGVLGEQRSVVSGQVDYQPGEEVVGFFLLNDRGQAVTLGLAQGKFHIWQNDRTGEKLARNPFYGQAEERRNKSPSGEDPATDRLSLLQLKQRVQGTTR